MNQTEVYKVLCTVCTERNNEVVSGRGSQPTVIVFFDRYSGKAPSRRSRLRLEGSSKVTFVLEG